MLTKNDITLKILLILGIVIVLNVVASFLFARLDFTGDGRYTLSNATKNILSDLDETATVTAYFSDNLPAQIGYVRNDFEDLLVEYANRSGGKVVYEFVNPNASPEKEQEAMQQGVQPMNVQVRNRDQYQEQRGYMGAKVQYGDKSEVIPALRPGAAMEYALSSAIKKIAGKNKPKIGVVTGHGEQPLSAMRQVAEQMNVLYEVNSVTLQDSAIAGYKTLIFVAPKDTFPPQDLAKMDELLAQGKAMFFAVNRVNADLQAGTATAVNTGLEGWLAQKGVTLNDNLAIDVNCGAVTVQQGGGGGFFSFAQQIKFPYLVLAANFADHPAVKGIEQMIFPFVSTLNFANKPGLTFTPLVMTSQKSGAETAPITFNVQRQLGEYGFNTANLVLGAAVEGNLGGGSNTKMVIYGDGDFCVNGQGQQQQNLAPDNVNLFSNAVDWLSDDSGLSELRTKVVTSRPIKRELSDSGRQFVKFGNFLLPLALILLYGFFRLQARRNKKLKWATERYN